MKTLKASLENRALRKGYEKRLEVDTGSRYRSAALGRRAPPTVTLPTPPWADDEEGTTMGLTKAQAEQRYVQEEEVKERVAVLVNLLMVVDAEHFIDSIEVVLADRDDISDLELQRLHKILADAVWSRA